MKTESTPFIKLSVTKNGKEIAEMNLYWSANCGVYGHQVVSSNYFNVCTEDQYHIEENTSGCGYSKDQHAFESFLSELFGSYQFAGGGADYLLRDTKAHKGGNFYQIPVTTLKKLLKKG